MKDLTPGASEKRFDDYYLIGEITSSYGTYSIYLEMDENWIKAYEADPSSVTYHLYVIRADVDLDEISSINI
ncbi:hypothetical protein [Streptococcus sp.]|uniref:hypothetical protein n=1 Tax=Streptococcus sp. TaxID=1306 RepID=UPI00391B3E44